jgi:hypothetical protein
MFMAVGQNCQPSCVAILEVRKAGVLRAALILAIAVPPPGFAAVAEDAVNAVPPSAHLPDLDDADLPLKAVRAALPDCEAGCITPGEATAMALSAAEGEAQPGRFLMDIRGGGQSFQGELGTMMFVNSRQDYATLGTLTIAFEPEALRALLRRAQVCGAADVVEGQITVKACYTDGPPDLNMFTMMQRLSGRRIIVEGDVRRQWIDSPLGSPEPGCEQARRA